MTLTLENKAYIDSLSYESLLSRWHFAPVGDKWFQDDLSGKPQTGTYWGERMAELRSQNHEEAVRASKSVGWDH